MASPRHDASLPRRLHALWRSPRIPALAAGAVAACGFQPLALWPLTLLGIAVLLELVARSRRPREAFALGWFFGLGHFALGNNWIATAFTYQANMPAWLGGIAVVLLATYLTLFPALACLTARLLVQRRIPAPPPETDTRPSLPFLPLALAFAATWIVTEWLRGWLFTGFAWNPLGIALLGSFESRGLALLSPWIGSYGLSGLLCLLAALPGIFVRLAAPRGTAGRLACALPPLAILGGLATLLSLPDPWAHRAEGTVRYTLVQPDIRQEFIDDPRQFEASFIKLAQLSLPQVPGRRRMVFWPESGLGDYIRDGYPPYVYRMFTYAGDPKLARERIGRVIGPYSRLMTGAVDLVMKGEDNLAARNSVTVLDGGGDILASYSKAHLVPFGEYLPLRGLLEPVGLSRLVPGTLDFWPGPGARTLDLGRYGRAGVQICYEIVFSGAVVDPAHRPDYIFNPSNDGWFGAWGPPQHLAQARLRALEEGLPVLRATTTGISAVIDADGIVRNFVPRHTAGRLDGFIPPAHEPTLFARLGNAIPLALAGILSLLSLSMVALRSRRR
ncbi:apolipoprotein N-acyltransferase [Novosphingobium decolorationis]|uniref:Apolipoprotein N-acyltransferase n=1 Tax=Novosphingobium decolorationis TaxID=2698673 RepID=A0ABX8E757_9SPHN|nr:apolipoprotein N-acyltransferase [Novosphingobium decolorationis]QVM84854.1 apolipoprotein N-acyltransferase [Novosphingobium decolorationis]